MNALPATRLAIVALGTAALFGTSPGTSYPRLYCGTDHSGFNGMNGMLAVAATNGAQAGKVKVYSLNFPLNGLTAATGYLMTGQPEDVGTVPGNTLRIVSESLPPTLGLTITPGSNSFTASCCNEQMVPAGNGTLYHAHYDDVIQQVSTLGGQSHVVATFAQSAVVGMAYDGSKFWISKWSERLVGTWDPASNVFTSVFATPSDAGGLAWDTANGVLWVGMQGGWVYPYDSTGRRLGPGFQPFGNISDTVDGLAFVSR